MAFELDHIHFRCENIDEAVEFYLKMFDGQITGRTGTSAMPIVFVNVAGTRLAFSPKRNGTELDSARSGPPRGIYQLGLVVDNMDRAVKELKAKGAEFESEPFEASPGLRIAFMKAPDGVQIELLEYS